MIAFNFTLGLVWSATASKVDLIVLRPPREAIGTATVVVILVLVADSQPTIKLNSFQGDDGST